MLKIQSFVLETLSAWLQNLPWSKITEVYTETTDRNELEEKIFSKLGSSAL